MEALVGAFNQEKALVGGFSVFVKTECETDGLYAALLLAVVFGLVLIYTVAVYQPRPGRAGHQ